MQQLRTSIKNSVEGQLFVSPRRCLMPRRKRTAKTPMTTTMVAAVAAMLRHRPPMPMQSQAQ